MLVPRPVAGGGWCPAVPSRDGGWLRTIRVVFPTKEECQAYCDERNGKA